MNKKLKKRQAKNHKKNDTKALFEKAFYKKDEESLKEIKQLIQRDPAVRRYVYSRIGKSRNKDVDKTIFSLYSKTATSSKKPYQGGSPGLGKKS